MYTNQMLIKRSDETYKEAMKILDETGRCVIIRPTGFGKTRIMCRISLRYKNVLYVYPTEIVHKQAEDMIKQLNHKNNSKCNVTFVTYSYLGKLNRKPGEFINEILRNNYDLIIFDEIHHMGAKLVKETLKVLSVLDSKKINILGGTATPDRMDGFDAIGEYFGNSIVSFYGIDDMIDDGLIRPLHYVYSTYGERWAFDELDKIRNTNIKVDIRKKESQISMILNASNIIRDTINNVYDGVTPLYMRFMVFFSKKEILKSKTKEVQGWLERAFPDYTVNDPLIIHSDASEKKNLEKLQALKTRPYTIDLIYSINMLNEGYHTDNITGCILLRPTLSQIVYSQQVGRCLQVGMEDIPIIFDFVSNLNTQALFGIKVQNIEDNNENKLLDSISKLNTVSKGHITVDNRVEEVKNVIERLKDSLLNNNTESAILDTRINYTYTAADISRVLKLPLYKVMQVLHNHRSELVELGLQLQDIDRYLNYMQHGKEEKVKEFDKYMEQIGVAF